MRVVIDISEYDKEWIGNAYGIPQDINAKIAEAIINAEPYQPEPHWIPVTERLPEVKQRVIVQYADESMAIRKCIDSGHLQWFYTKMGIVAWMPSPEPYKGATT